jgi:PDZ domain-containing protein
VDPTSSSGAQIITVNSAPVRATTGNLNLTTVQADTTKITVIGAILGWLKSGEAVVPYDSIYPPGRTTAQVNQQNAQAFTSSQDSATAAAACELGYPQGFGVVSVASDSVNAKALRSGDQFLTVAGHPIPDSDALTSAVKDLPVGGTVAAVVKRTSGTSVQQVSIPLKLGSPSSGSSTPRLGIEVADTCLTPFQVTVSLLGIGGPSAGLMFALGVIDKIGPGDLTHGKFIAGTGTIDTAGTVGPIGGIQLKMLGARAAGATIFLAPQANCNDVRGNVPTGLAVVPVGTLHDAVTNLNLINQGKPVPHC